jgi:hypothetical protein
VQKPTSDTLRKCAAKVTNVAEALRYKLKAEFPEFSVQAMFRCFQLDEQGPNAMRVSLVSRLARVMKADAMEENTMAGEFVTWYPRALNAKTTRKLSGIEAWACIVATAGTVRALPGPQARALPGPQARVLPGPEGMGLSRLLRIVRAFLITETECGRNLSGERHQYINGPSLSSAARFAGLKVMLDGLLLDKLASKPIGPFLRLRPWDGLAPAPLAARLLPGQVVAMAQEAPQSSAPVPGYLAPGHGGVGVVPEADLAAQAPWVIRHALLIDPSPRAP